MTYTQETTAAITHTIDKLGLSLADIHILRIDLVKNELVALTYSGTKHTAKLEKEPTRINTQKK